MNVNFKQCALALAVSTTALSSLAKESLVLEEVLVTSQLRTESLQDVSASVSAMSGERMMEAGVNKLEDLQAYVPNLSMSETGIGTNIYIRGIGSGINQGFEQSVGMYVDGVYYGRSQLARAPFLDLARVEVMRGPQNILYGKNSIAGAMSIVTNKPGDEFEGSVSALYESEYGEQVYDMVLSGPITDDFGARLAYRNRQLDGYIDNIDFGDEPERDEETVRLILDWAVTDNLDAILKYEHGSFDIKGRQIEIVQDNRSLNPALGGANWGQFLSNFGAPLSVLDSKQNGKRSSNGDFSNNTTDNLTLTVNYAMDDYTLTSITGGVQYKYDEQCDCDFTSADLFFVDSQEEYKQLSQEIRIASPAGEQFDWIAGVYYQKSELDFEDQFYVTNSSILPQVLATVLAASPSPATASLAPLSPLLRGQQVPRVFSQDSELWSTFAQVTWNIQDDLRLTVGGRYSAEDKEASRKLTGISPLADNLLGAIFKVSPHDLKDDRSENNFAPSAIVEYDFNDQVMAYASWTKGNKSGGYDVRSNSPDFASTAGISSIPVQPGTFEYDEEQAQSVELGLKSTLANGAAELNVVYFVTNFEDLQVSIYDGVLGFNVGNAAEATSQGVEIDGRVLVTESLTLSGAVAWMDFEFDDYPNGQCTQQERIATGATECDFKGKTNQYVAEWSGVVSADHAYDISDGLELRTTVDVIFSSEYNPSQTIDDAIEQGGYYKLNARLALADTQGKWDVALIGKNLTDQNVITYANDTPLSANLGASIGFYSLVEPGKTLAIQGTYRF